MLLPDSFVHASIITYGCYSRISRELPAIALDRGRRLRIAAVLICFLEYNVASFYVLLIALVRKMCLCKLTSHKHIFKIAKRYYKIITQYSIVTTLFVMVRLAITFLRLVYYDITRIIAPLTLSTTRQ